MGTTYARRRPRLGRAAVVGSFTLGLLAAGCSATSSTGTTPSSEGTVKLNEKDAALEADAEPTTGGKLVVAVPGETNGWNPIEAQWADAGSLEGSAFIEPLITLDNDGNWEMFLADKIDHNADFTQWDITVKPNIPFHDGTMLDGKAVQKTLTASYTSGLAQVALAPLYDHVEQTGPLSVKVFLKRSWSQYPASLNTNGRIMALAMYDAPDHGATKPIGTGPFVFQSWEQGKQLQAKKFDKYWRKDSKGRQLPFLDEIEFRPLTDKDSMEKALQAKDVDVALSTSAQVANRIGDDFEVLRDWTSERTFVMLNTAEAAANAPNPFTNLHARRALAYATNRKDIVPLVGDNVQTTAQGYRTDSKWGLPEDQAGYYAYDLAKAKEEVEAYKKDTGKPSLTFTFIGLTNVEDSTIMQALQQQWAEAGIEAKLENFEQIRYITTVVSGLYQAAWFRWYGWQNPDSNTTFNAAETNKPIGELSINFTHYTSTRMEANLKAQRESDDVATRKKANDDIIRETNEQAVNIWLFDTPYSIIASQDVHGLNSFRTHSFGNYSSKPWWGEVWIQS